MKTFGKNDSDYLYKSRVTLDNIQKSPEIATALAEKGFTTDRIQEGLTLYGKAEQVFRSLIEKRRTWRSKGAGLTGKYREVFGEYAGYVKRMRAELKEDPETTATLELEGKRQRFIAGFIEQATHFYDKGINDPDVFTKLQALGYSAELLQASFDRFVEYQSMRSDYEKLYGECQKLVVDKNQAIRRLKNWMRALKEAAKVVYADNLQTLEEIGLFMRNNPKPTQDEEAPADTAANTPADSSSDTNSDPGTGV